MIIKMNNTDVTSLLLSYKRSGSMKRIVGNAPSTSLKISLDNEDKLFDYEKVKDAIFEVQQTLNSHKYFYKVYEMPETWDEVIELTLYDSLYNLDIPYATKLIYPVTILEQLIEISSLTGISINHEAIDNTILHKEVFQYDSTITIRSYLRWIAEISGCNVYPGLNEFYSIRFVKFNNQIFIAYDDVFDYKKANPYVISKVSYNDGLNIYENGTNDSNTYFLSSDNLYISKEEDIEIVSQMLKGLSLVSIPNVECDYTDNLLLGSIVNLMNSFSFIVLEFEEDYAGGDEPDLILKGELSTENQEAVGVKISNLNRIRRLKVNVDEQNLKLDIIAKNVDHQTELLKNSINVSLSLNYVNTQTRDEELDKYYPDYTVNPLKITAIAKDTLKEVIANAVFTFKRKGQNDEEFVDLLDEEVANNNVLTISHNLNESVEYIAYATVTTEDGTILTAENSISINYNLIKSMEVDGSMCSIVTTTNDFVFGENDYEPNNIVLTPQLFSCNFDSYSYSTDLGLSYTIIEIGDEIVEEVESEDGSDPQALDSHMFYTNIEGVHFNNETNELIVQSSAKCFDLTNVVIFKLKTDVQGYENTTTLTKTTDVNYQLNNIMSEINALVEENKNLSLQLDGLNNTISTKVEEIETTYTDDITAIKQQLSNVIQTATSIEEQFTTLKEIIDENGSDLQTITTYIRKTAKGIEVGELDANVKTLMGTSYFAILFNNEEKMTLEQNLLTIENVKALMGFQLGNSLFTSHDNGFYITWGGD